MRCCLLVLAIASSCPTTARAGEWAYRLYGYRPRVYGYAPSDYVFPRYGFQRGYVYVEGPPYGSPALGPPALCHGPADMPPEFPLPEAQIEPSAEVTPSAPSKAASPQSPAAQDGAARSSRRRTDGQARRTRPAASSRATTSISLKVPTE